MKSLISFFLIFSISQSFNCRELSKVVSIPFTLTSSNNISIQVILNEIDSLNMMFHTGASAVFITEDAVQNLQSIKMDGSAKVNSWGGSGDVRFSENNTIQIGSMQWDSLTITEDKLTGPGMDGKFGYNLFEDKVIELNFESSILQVYESLPEKASTYQKMEYIYKLGSMFIKGTAVINDKEYNNEFMIHSGYSGALLFDDQFVADYSLGSLLEVISEQDLKDSMGNIIKTKKSKLPLLRIGETEFKDITVGMFEGALGRQRFSVMGGEMLKRFNWIFDFKQETVYLEYIK